MTSPLKLKDEARRFEQQEDWDRAIQIYLRVLRAAEEAGNDVELPLYNRVGDLYLKLGRAPDAVRYYERAADRYAEAGFYNNALALCNKALRHAPDRLELMRKLGRFSALQGFATDAHRWFHTYAEQMSAQGGSDDAHAALEELAELSAGADVTSGSQLPGFEPTIPPAAPLPDFPRWGEKLELAPAAPWNELNGGDEPERPAELHGETNGGAPAREVRPRARAATTPIEPPSDGYVDLSSLVESDPARSAETHYDLGLAYKEMGLINEAISEFQLSLRTGGGKRLEVLEELGQCFLTSGQDRVAVKVLEAAAATRCDDHLELIGVYYYLGRAYEAVGRHDEARDAYERVIGLDMEFKDVTQRLARL